MLPEIAGAPPKHLQVPVGEENFISNKLVHVYSSLRHGDPSISDSRKQLNM